MNIIYRTMTLYILFFGRILTRSFWFICIQCAFFVALGVKILSRVEGAVAPILIIVLTLIAATCALFLSRTVALSIVLVLVLIILVLVLILLLTLCIFSSSCTIQTIEGSGVGSGVAATIDMVVPRA